MSALSDDDVTRLNAFLDALEAHSTGLVLLSNLAFDVNRGRIDKSLARDLFQKVAARWSRGSGRRPERVMQEVLIEHASIIANARTTAAQYEPCSRLITDVELLAYLDRKRLGLIGDEIIDEDLLDDIQADGLSNVYVRASAAVGSKNGLAWVTKTSQLDLLYWDLPVHERSVDTLRDAAGLAYMIDQTRLLELRYPANLSLLLFAPTILEGAPHVYYRSCVSNDGWGRAVDLRHFAGHGLPEAIHSPCPISGAGFRVSKIGATESTPPQFAYDKAFKCCPEPWSQARRVAMMTALRNA